jgi:hypothetical protein
MAVCHIAVLQVLHAFPVSGSQVVFGNFLLVLVGGLCIADGVIEARAFLGSLATPASVRKMAKPVAGLLIAAMTFVVAYSSNEQRRTAQATFDKSVSLDLPGAHLSRVPPTQRAAFHTLIRELRRNDCTSFLTLPGINGLYLLTETTPPVYLNSSNWTTVFDNDQQQRALDRVRDIHGLCVVRNQASVFVWRTYSRVKRPGVLETFIQQKFKVVSHTGGAGGFDLMVRK